MPELWLKRYARPVLVTGLAAGVWLFVFGSERAPTPLQARSSMAWWVPMWWVVAVVATVAMLLLWGDYLGHVVARWRGRPLGTLVEMVGHSMLAALGLGRAVFSLVELGEEGLVGAGVWVVVAMLALRLLDTEARRMLGLKAA